MEQIHKYTWTNYVDTERTRRAEILFRETDPTHGEVVGNIISPKNPSMHSTASYLASVPRSDWRMTELSFRHVPNDRVDGEVMLGQATFDDLGGLISYKFSRERCGEIIEEKALHEVEMMNDGGHYHLKPYEGIFKKLSAHYQLHKNVPESLKLALLTLDVLASKE